MLARKIYSSFKNSGSQFMYVKDFLNRNRLKRDDCKSLVNFVSISLTKKKSNADMDKVVTFIVTSKLQKDLLDKQTD